MPRQGSSSYAVSVAPIVAALALSSGCGSDAQSGMTRVPADTVSGGAAGTAGAQVDAGAGGTSGAAGYAGSIAAAGSTAFVNGSLVFEEGAVDAAARDSQGNLLLLRESSAAGQQRGILITKRSSAGATEWELPLEHGAYGCQALAIDVDDSIVIACSVERSVKLGEFAWQVPPEQRAVVLARITASGVPSWAKLVGTGSFVNASAVALDASGNIHVAGMLIGAVDFGGAVLNSQSYDGYVASFSADGVQLRSRLYGDSRWQGISSITATAEGLLMAGSFEGAIDFGGLSLRTKGFGVSNLFIAEVSAAGEATSAERIPSGGLSHIEAVADEQRICAAGSFNDSIELTGSVTSARSDDLFVHCRSRSSGAVFSRTFGSEGLDFFGGVALTETGLVATASSAGQIEIDGRRLGDPEARSVVVVEFDAQGQLVQGHAFGCADLCGAFPLVDGARLTIAGYFDRSLQLPTATLESADSAGFVFELARP